jgi:tryptophan synthase alpha chain
VATSAMSSEAASPAGLGRGFPPNRAALVVYLMAGYPDRAGSLAAMHVVADAGADVIELGVPYTDQLADGPVIVRASSDARHAAGGRFGLAETLKLAEEFVAERRSTGVPCPPIALMTYLNPVIKFGFADAAAAMAGAGIAGAIIPDLPPDNPMSTDWLSASGPRGLDTVFLVAPTSTPERMKTVAEASTGFVYCVSSVGITGERAHLRDDLAEVVARVKLWASVPVAVGFGVSTPEQAAEVARIADGVVVGSAVVRRQSDLDALYDFIGELASAVSAAR